jgi:circadian clock protein KaiC
LWGLSILKRFVIGVSGLDRLVGEVVAPYTILIAGHPGAGKTTLASTICYANALKGEKCLYITFYEDKEKLFRYMERLGLKLREIELSGLFKFMKLPLTFDINMIIDEVTKLVAGGYSVIVIDSITALLDVVREHVEKRAWLLNYFYQLPVLFNGLLILVSELPFGEERIGLGSIEFVVDSIFILKHRIEDHFLTRLIEVRKTRGVPINIAEAYFAMVENIGIVVFTPPILQEIPHEGEELIPICNALKNVIGHIHKGFIINVFFPPEAPMDRETMLVILSAALKYNLRVLVLSYTSSPGVLIETLRSIFYGSGLSAEEIDKLIEKHLIITALNPFGYSLADLVAYEQILIDQLKPDVVIFHGVHLASAIHSEYKKYLRELFNEVMYLKSRGITVVRIGSYIDDYIYRIETSIADVTFKIERIYKEDGTVDFKIYVNRRYREPKILSSTEMKECIQEVIDLIKSYTKKEN